MLLNENQLDHVFGGVKVEEKEKLPNLSKFGLNKAKLEKFEKKVNEDGSFSYAFTFDIKGKKFWSNIGSSISVWKSGILLTDTESEDYKKGYENEYILRIHSFVHYATALGVDKETTDEIKKNNKEGDTIYKLLEDEIYKSIDGREVEVDLFLEYQWTFKERQTITFLQIPKNVKFGSFIVPHQPGNWVEERTWTIKDEDGAEVVKNGIRYVDGANIHEFYRNSYFAGSNKANQQTRTLVDSSKENKDNETYLGPTEESKGSSKTEEEDNLPF